MKAQNKWNGGLYEVIEEVNKEVTLKYLKDRKYKPTAKEKPFTISKSEFHFSYKTKIMNKL